jgi:hypothetical protein
VAHEAGNSASIIFKHYRELTTPEVAEKCFSILPKHAQWENTFIYDRKKRRVILNGVEVAALPVWLGFAIALSAFSVSLFSISALPSLPFPQPPIFANGYDRQAGPTQWLFKGPPVESKFPVTVGAIIAESVASNAGIGRLMMVASSRFDVPLVVAELLTTGMMGIVLYWIAEVIERRTTGRATRSTDQNLAAGG